jgi:hypothetical protein
MGCRLLFFLVEPPVNALNSSAIYTEFNVEFGDEGNLFGVQDSAKNT